MYLSARPSTHTGQSYVVVIRTKTINNLFSIIFSLNPPLPLENTFSEYWKEGIFILAKLEIIMILFVKNISKN